MALRIETFDNTRGGNALYKALTHPAAARPARALLEKLARHAPVAVYDAGGAVEAFGAIYDLDQIEIAGAYVHQVARVGSVVLGHAVSGNNSETATVRVANGAIGSPIETTRSSPIGVRPMAPGGIVTG